MYLLPEFQHKSTRIKDFINRIVLITYRLVKEKCIMLPRIEILKW